MSVVLVNDHIRRVQGQPNVIRIWHWVLFAVGHAQRKSGAAGNCRLNLLSRHNNFPAGLLDRSHQASFSAKVARGGQGVCMVWSILSRESLKLRTTLVVPLLRTTLASMPFGNSWLDK